MEKIIVYGSQYGTTKRYADELSKKTGIKALAYTEVSDLSAYDTILYLGGLYAGGVLGLAKTIKRCSVSANQTLIVVTVGLADPKVLSNTDHIKQSISKQLPSQLYNKATIFHLRGGIDYQKLSFIHKNMMKFIYNKTKDLPPDRQTEETKAMIETYNQKVDFVDMDSLNEIITAL